MDLVKYYLIVEHLQAEAIQRLDKLAHEIVRIDSNMLLSATEKKNLKDSTISNILKPIKYLLNKLCESTINKKSSLSENERSFIDVFGTSIISAMEKLNHVCCSSPRSAWKPFQQLIQDIMLHTIKHRTITLADVSPFLANMKGSKIPLPGYGDPSVTVERLSDVILILPTKTKPKRIELLSSEGLKSLFLLKGNEDLHLGTLSLKL